jgi:hypothetical protein
VSKNKWNKLQNTYSPPVYTSPPPPPPLLLVWVGEGEVDGLGGVGVGVEVVGDEDGGGLSSPLARAPLAGFDEGECEAEEEVYVWAG